MEDKFKQFINSNKDFVVFYLIWFLLNLIFISISDGSEGGFWPFLGMFATDIDNYGITEFIFYLIVPIVIWALWKLVGEDIKKKLDENN